MYKIQFLGSGTTAAFKQNRKMVCSVPILTTFIVNALVRKAANPSQIPMEENPSWSRVHGEGEDVSKIYLVSASLETELPGVAKVA